MSPPFLLGGSKPVVRSFHDKHPGACWKRFIACPVEGEQEAVFPSLDFLGLVIEAPVMAGLTGSSAAGCRYFLLYQEFV